jgi:hypothetical protein
VFLGLSAITVTMLRAEGFALGFIGPWRALLLGGTAFWTIVLGWKIGGACGCADFTALRGNPLDCGCCLDWRGKLFMLFWVWQ